MSFLDYLRQEIEKKQKESKSLIRNDTDKVSSKSKQLDLSQIKQSKESIEQSIKINSSKEKHPKNYLYALKHKLTQSIIKEWITGNPNKKLLSVTEVIVCPYQTWSKLSGMLTKEDIDEESIFYLLRFYGWIGDTVHKKVYSMFNFEYSEIDLKDEANYLRGRFDILDQGNLIDIKSSLNKSDVSPQLALYVHLLRKNGYNVKKL